MAQPIFTTQENVYDQEILVFLLNNQWYGLNVLKVKEIIRPMTIHMSPNQNTMVEGIIRLRDQAVPVLNTYQLLQIEEESANYFIIIEHGDKTFALKATDVSKIERIQSKDMHIPDALSQEKDAFVSSVVTFDEEHILYLFDVERVIHVIHPTHFEEDFIEEFRLERSRFSLLLIEDSPTMQLIITEALRDAGYEQITIFANGEDAWHFVEEQAETVDLCITDIDVPLLNGFDFTKKVRSLPLELPIISFSSLHAHVMLEKGKQVGINEHVQKPDIKQLLHTLDTYLVKQ
ncbi:MULTISPECIES: chemotaxis protein CheV [Shouchella]|uniref:Chemotaxis protein n=2 Tax=Shouchella TaxID=2893057 RepID=A0ABY7W823_9BACI|nr:MULTISPECIES: chemotaxis protein [Shouchella]MED4127174.1 chemotaxis protein [Shouchella miscanthi]WDF03656.1 chemotaxis protein [Shouchella hunanensis]